MDHSTKYNRVSRVRLVIWPLLAVGALTALGCEYLSFGAQVPVIWGRVTHNGKPLKDGFVTFTPEAADSDEGMIAVNTDGSYRVAWDYRGRPLVTGWYRISVIPNQLPRAKPPESESGSTRNGGKDSNEESQPPQTEVSEIPLAYYDAKTSHLRIWVRPQLQRVDINLLD